MFSTTVVVNNVVKEVKVRSSNSSSGLTLSMRTFADFFLGSMYSSSMWGVSEMRSNCFCLSPNSLFVRQWSDSFGDGVVNEVLACCSFAQFNTIIDWKSTSSSSIRFVILACTLQQTLKYYAFPVPSGNIYNTAWTKLYTSMKFGDESTGEHSWRLNAEDCLKLLLVPCPVSPYRINPFLRFSSSCFRQKSVMFRTQTSNSFSRAQPLVFVHELI